MCPVILLILEESKRVRAMSEPNFRQGGGSGGSSSSGSGTGSGGGSGSSGGFFGNFLSSWRATPAPAPIAPPERSFGVTSSSSFGSSANSANSLNSSGIAVPASGVAHGSVPSASTASDATASGRKPGRTMSDATRRELEVLMTLTT